MGSVVRDVDQECLAEMMAWADGILDFQPHHAADGLYIASSAMLKPVTHEDLLAASLNTAFTFWIDDRSDKHLGGAGSPVDWSALLELTDGHPTPGAAAEPSPELRFLRRLAGLFEQRSVSPADYAFWKKSMGLVFRGMRFEEQTSCGPVPPSYSEYVEFGAASIAIWAVLAGLYISNRLSRSERFGDPWLDQLERYLGMSQRLKNDLFSSEKERRENPTGCVSNSVLLLERHLPPDKARSFVAEQLQGYDTLIEAALDALGPTDPYARSIRPMLACINRWYDKAPVRYQLPGG